AISSNVGIDFGVDFVTGNDSAGGIQFCEPSGGNCSVISGGGTNNSILAFGTNGNNERMRITKDGNVGIGTTSPSEALTLGDGNIQINSEGANPLIVFTRDGVEIARLETQTYGNRLRIDVNGDDQVSFYDGYTMVNNLYDADTGAEVGRRRIGL